MSYILDALKKSDRNRQLNSTHSLSISDNEVVETRPWKKLFLLGLCLLAMLLIFWFFSKDKTETQVSVVESGEGVVKTELIDELGIDDLSIDEMDAALATEEDVPTLLNPAPTNNIAPTRINLNNQDQQLSENVELDEPNPDNLDQVLNVQENVEIESQTLSNNSQSNVVRQRENQSRNGIETLLGQPSKPRPKVQLEDVGEANNSVPLPSKQAKDNQEFPNYRTMHSRMAGLAALHLDILAYHQEEAESQAYINMKKYSVGDTIEEGASITAIRSDGVVMEYRGTEFILTAR